MCACRALAPPLAAAPLLVISIDGLHPSYVIEADRRGVDIPVRASFVRDGAYASGVIGVLPTVTFPSHTTLVTGVSPAEHGIVANTPFDPLHTIATAGTGTPKTCACRRCGAPRRRAA